MATMWQLTKSIYQLNCSPNMSKRFQSSIFFGCRNATTRTISTTALINKQYEKENVKLNSHVEINHRRWTMQGTKRLCSKMTDILAHQGHEVPTVLVSYGEKAFLINETLVLQPVILFPKKFLMWNARTFEDITIESLSAVTGNTAF